jgi:phasin family protein
VPGVVEEEVMPSSKPSAKSTVVKPAPETAPKPQPASIVVTAKPVAAAPAPKPAVRPAAPKPAAKPKLPAATVVAAPVEAVVRAAGPLHQSLKHVQPEITKVDKMTKLSTIKGYDELTAISKANIDALVRANQVFAKGVEEISKEMLSLTQSSLESAATAAKAIFGAKTLKDVVELNADFTRTHFDKLVSNSTKLGEMSVKLATDTLAPITARVNVAVEKAVKPAA